MTSCVRGSPFVHVKIVCYTADPESDLVHQWRKVIKSRCERGHDVVVACWGGEHTRTHCGTTNRSCGKTLAVSQLDFWGEGVGGSVPEGLSALALGGCLAF
jgi:hypothetical protein